MDSFGYFATMLPPRSVWGRITGWLPEKTQYRRGPVRAGEIFGTIAGETVRGWGWRLPQNPRLVWEFKLYPEVGERLIKTFRQLGVKIIGIEYWRQVTPLVQWVRQSASPGISDGKALELLFFLSRFRNILHNYEISAQKAKTVIVWEEGNLGMVCARLIAAEVRFMTLINPYPRILEQAAAVIMAESGVAPRILNRLPADPKGGFQILIKCGNLSRFKLAQIPGKTLKYELFQDTPSLAALNIKLPLEVATKNRMIPVYPALAETIIRTGAGLHQGCWFGPDLALERVLKLAKILNGLGLGISL